MKLVLLSMNFSPELTGIGKYSGEMARALAQRGHEVRVICAPPYYPQWTVQAGYSPWRYRTEEPMTGLKVHRCPVWLPKRMSGLRRLLHLASFALSSLPMLVRVSAWRPTHVLVVAPALFNVPAARLTAWACGARSWLHVQDFEVDAAFELGLLRGEHTRRFALHFERLLLRGFDKVSTISDRMQSRLVEKGVRPERAALLPNWVDLDAIRPVDRSPLLRLRLGITEDRIVCLFSGTINRKQGVEVLVAAAAQLQDLPEALIVICGEGELRDELRQRAQALCNVCFIDLQPARELNALLNMADIHLLPQLRGAADLVMPSKLTGMLASGRPVIAAAKPGTEIEKVVRDTGRVVEPESASEFAAAVRELAGDAALRLRLGGAGRQFAQVHLGAAAVFDALTRQLVEIGHAPSAVASPSQVVHLGDMRGANTAPPASNQLHVQIPVNRPAPGSWGFTLLELLVVMVIIGLLAAYVGPKYFSQVGKSEVKTAKAQIVGLEKALDQYRLDVGRYPSTEEGLMALMRKPAEVARWEGPYLGKTLPADPWGRPYVYKAPGERGDIDIVSLGRDGRLGGDGPDADIGNW